MAAVATDTGLGIDDDAFINHRQGSSRTNVDAFPAADARIDQKKNRCLTLLLHLPADIPTENKGDDQGVNEAGTFLYLDTYVVFLYQSSAERAG